VTFKLLGSTRTDLHPLKVSRKGGADCDYTPVGVLVGVSGPTINCAADDGNDVRLISAAVIVRPFLIHEDKIRLELSWTISLAWRSVWNKMSIFLGLLGTDSLTVSLVDLDSNSCSEHC
jgi:hypothetical protein